MAKYIIKEKDYIDTFLGKIFINIAKGIQSNVEKDIAKKDPALAKKLKDLRKKRDDIKSHLRSKRK
jgi:hypothetical protein